MLPKLSDNQSERKQSPRYVPAPWGDRELGEILDTGDSPTRRKRLAKKRRNADQAAPVAAPDGEEEAA